MFHRWLLYLASASLMYSAHVHGKCTCVDMFVYMYIIECEWLYGLAVECTYVYIP